MNEQTGHRWDDRFQHERFFYGEEPTCFVAGRMEEMATGQGHHGAAMVIEFTGTKGPVSLPK